MPFAYNVEIVRLVFDCTLGNLTIFFPQGSPGEGMIAVGIDFIHKSNCQLPGW